MDNKIILNIVLDSIQSNNFELFCSCYGLSSKDMALFVFLAGLRSLEFGSLDKYFFEILHKVQNGSDSVIFSNLISNYFESLNFRVKK